LPGRQPRLRKHHAEKAGLSIHRQALVRIPLMAIQVLPITQSLVEAATSLSQQHQLLTGDALIVAVMGQHGLVNLASGDNDFDRVPAITRYAPA
jgi:predicted nucleic acid-binding protein